MSNSVLNSKFKKWTSLLAQNPRSQEYKNKVSKYGTLMVRASQSGGNGNGVDDLLRKIDKIVTANKMNGGGNRKVTGYRNMRGGNPDAEIEKLRKRFEFQDNYFRKIINGLNKALKDEIDECTKKTTVLDTQIAQLQQAKTKLDGINSQNVLTIKNLDDQIKSLTEQLQNKCATADSETSNLNKRFEELKAEKNARMEDIKNLTILKSILDEKIDELIQTVKESNVNLQTKETELKQLKIILDKYREGITNMPYEIADIDSGIKNAAGIDDKEFLKFQYDQLKQQIIDLSEERQTVKGYIDNITKQKTEQLEKSLISYQERLKILTESKRANNTNDNVSIDKIMEHYATNITQIETLINHAIFDIDKLKSKIDTDMEKFKELIKKIDKMVLTINDDKLLAEHNLWKSQIESFINIS